MTFISAAASAVASVAAATGIIQSSTSSAPALTVTYDAASQSYTLTDASHSAVVGPADIVSNSAGQVAYAHPDGSDLTLFTTTPTSHQALSYMGLGIWANSTTSGGTQTTTYDTFTFGNPTPGSATPRTGQASYDIDLVGYLTNPGFETKSLGGSGEFDVDFASGVFKATVSPAEVGLVSRTEASGGGYQFIASGALSSSASTFSGGVLYLDNGTSYSGSASGQFYGPSAQEVGASFTGANANGGSLVGSFFGAQAGAVGGSLDMINPAAAQQFTLQAVDLSVSTPPSTYDAGQYATTDQLTLMPGGTVSSFVPSNTLLSAANFTSADIVTSSMPNFTTYKTTVSGAPIELDIYKTGSSNTELDLTYTDLGIWSQGAQQPTQVFNNYHYFVFGLLTPQATISGQTGSAQYTGVAYGGAVNVSQAAQYNLTGTSAFDVNFGAQTLSGNLNLTGTRVGGGPNATFDTFTFAGAIPANNGVGAALPITQDGVNVGQIQNQFYGPRAEEIGGVFTINEPSGEAAIQGATVAKLH